MQGFSAGARVGIAGPGAVQTSSTACVLGQPEGLPTCTDGCIEKSSIATVRQIERYFSMRTRKSLCLCFVSRLGAGTSSAPRRD